MEEKNSINWYPGHMKKTREEIIKNIKLVNLVVEIVDARAPISSKNPDIDSMINGKSKLVVLTKKDLADEEDMGKFISYYKEKGIKSVAINSTKKTGISPLINILEQIKEENYQKNKARGIIKKPLRIMIVGIPNVGKSTLINQIIGKKSAKTGNTPGITKSQQWLKIKGDIELLDTPGILWPKIEDKITAQKLAFLGSIRDQVIEIEDIYYEFIKFLIENKKQKNLFEEFEINFDETDFEKISEIIAKKRGVLLKNNEVDYFRLANIVLNEFRNGKYGKIQLDEI
ncbi:ribosome biogenesis GTP-binding protein YlqF [Peptoanaerobacter stomatis]|uniref:Ribosome biogenesis GTPase A n=1 Tax=Peptoanaerobacter stomatis TaxID=796937 RepID=J5U3S0_9FIRM|nr:ribosome biogenesis GTPase YlqF [Peptoanaerobacter stomatis]EJU19564.1 ribosome biogenesis GTP-binding protein YlqF [Peptoanaerobacter stomatis]NWO25342.1 ribosome biogenesis GTPase YlqF [Peptostreptococcaceae bacterium oral taxon 081]